MHCAHLSGIRDYLELSRSLPRCRKNFLLFTGDFVDLVREGGDRGRDMRSCRASGAFGF